VPRNLTADYIAALAEGYLYPVILVQIQFASGTVYMSSFNQPILLDGTVYSGVGSLMEISTIEDGSSVNARGVTVTLSGIDPTLLPATMDEFQVGLPAAIYLGLFGTGGQLQMDQSVLAWAGRTDQPTISSDQDTASISINLESVLLDMNTPVPYRWTQIDQQKFFPGDQGFAWVNSIQSVPLYWGQNTNSGTDGNP
jgi:hypothetical protein